MLPHMEPHSQAFGTAGEPVTAHPQPLGRLRADRELGANSCGGCGARDMQKGMWEGRVRVGMEGLDVGFQECHQSLKGVEPVALPHHMCEYLVRHLGARRCVPKAETR